MQCICECVRVMWQSHVLCSQMSEDISVFCLRVCVCVCVSLMRLLQSEGRGNKKIEMMLEYEKHTVHNGYGN